MANYQGKHVRKRSRRVPLSVWLAYLLVATLIATGVTFSGYVTEAQGSDSARVAVMAADVTTIVSGAIAPGETLETTFQINNYEIRDGKTVICEVAQEYTIQNIKLVSNPVSSNGTVPENLTGVQFAVFNSNGEQISLPYNGGRLEPGVEQSETYTIKATWPQADQGEALSFEIDAIEVIVNAQQID